MNIMASTVTEETKNKLRTFNVTPSYCMTIEAKNGDQKQELSSLSLKLTVSNPSRLLHLCEHLTDDSSKSLEVKINNYLIKEGECETAFLIHLKPSCEEAFVQAVGGEELENTQRFFVAENAIKRLVQYENSALKCDDNLDPQIAGILNGLYKHLGHQFVLVPVLCKRHKYFPCSSKNIKPVTLVCFVDSRKEEDFQVRLANELFRYCQTVLLNTITMEEEIRLNRRYESLLRSGSKLFTHLENTHNLFENIIREAKELLSAKYCCIYFVDSSMVKMFKEAFEIDPHIKNVKMGVIKNEKILKHVVTSGVILNIKNADEHPLFDSTIVEGFRTKIKNVVGFPIRNEKQIMGVMLLCNKKRGDFCSDDEKLGKFFGYYCGQCISHGFIYKQSKETQERSQLSNEMMIQYKKVADDDVVGRMNCGLLHVHSQLNEFSFPPNSVSPRETVCFILQMFEELGFIKTYSINRGDLTRFIMLVQKCHKNVPYHNWLYSFSSTHFAYLCLKKFQLVEKGYISNLEALAYFLACLCHNLDHQGVNNPFQQKHFKALTIFYSSQGSVIQRYQLAQVLSILNIDGCNILKSLDSDKYRLCLHLLKDMILAKDLVNHFKLYRRQYLMTQEGYKKENPEHKYIFVCLLITCACFCDQVKDWSHIRQTIANVFEEFLSIGYVEEKSEKQPVLLPVQSKQLVPDLQIEFLKSVCLPAFKLLALLFPEAKDLAFKIKKNILYWEASRPLFREAYMEQRSCIDVLKDEEFEKKIEAIINSLNK